MKTALVIGGTGPTGEYVVNGLEERGYEVTIFHSGAHEAEFATPVSHIHGDPHFLETIKKALGNQSWDVVISQYGRLRYITEHFKGRTGHLVGIGSATRLMANPADPRWGMHGRPAVVDENQILLEDDKQVNKLGWRMAEALRKLFVDGQAGEYRTTYIGYPLLYGPRQIAARDWSIVRRLLDGRRRIIMADGGLKLESRGFTENVAQAPLLAIDQPEISDRQSYVVADKQIFTMRQRIQFIANHMGRDVSLIDMPFDLARPIHPFYRDTSGHLVRSTEKIRNELGYKEAYSPDDGMRRTIDWLIANRPSPGGEVETQLGDPFDYEREDCIIDSWLTARAELPDLSFDLPGYAHSYRHPTKPNEGWRRPEKFSRWDT